MTYNISRFHIRHYDLRKFAGPKVGEVADDFEVVDLDESKVRLSDYRGRWVVLEAASVTCSMYSRNVDAMQNLAARYPDTDFLLLYVREAHPGERLAQHESMADKMQAAARLNGSFGEKRRILVDNHNGDVHRAWGELPNWIYLIGPEGDVRYRCDWAYMSGIENALENRERLSHQSHATLDDLSGRSFSHSLKTMKIGGWLAIFDFFRSLPAMVREHRLHDREFLEQSEHGDHK